VSGCVDGCVRSIGSYTYLPKVNTAVYYFTEGEEHTHTQPGCVLIAHIQVCVCGLQYTLLPSPPLSLTIEREGGEREERIPTHTHT
jgi:hypothetical protein